MKKLTTYFLTDQLNVKYEIGMPIRRPITLVTIPIVSIGLPAAPITPPIIAPKTPPAIPPPTVAIRKNTNQLLKILGLAALVVGLSSEFGGLYILLVSSIDPPWDC
jgi:hypothetical protein